MKCKICRKKGFRTIAGIAAHYRKKHPQALKKKKTKGSNPKTRRSASNTKAQIRRLLDKL